MFCVALLLVGVLEAAEPAPQFLSDALAERISSSQAWGTLGFDTAVQPSGRPAVPLRIKDKHYRHGLGHHANGEITVALEGLFQTFECEVGLQWQGGRTPGSVVFQVYVDDKMVFQSGVMRENDPPRTLRLPIGGADVLRLVATDAGDGINSDCADWAEARLTPDPAAGSRIAQTAVDIAPFARVVSSDPRRMKGTAAGRVEPFPAADIALESELKPPGNGGYAVPLKPGNPSAIGLRWYEMRSLRRLELHWANAGGPPADAVQLQHWVGISPWQGEWKPLLAKLDRAPGVWSWQIAHKNQPAGTYRVRWVFATSARPLAIKRISAFSRSSWGVANLRAEISQPTALTLALSRRERGPKELPSPASGRGAGGEGGSTVQPASKALTLTLSQREREPTQILITNGNFLDVAGQDNALSRSWDVSRPLPLQVRYSKPRPHKVDRTVLRFELPGQPISVAVEDVVAHGCVYVPSAGLFVTLDPPQITLVQYLKNIAGKKTVLEQVRALPDQSFSAAMTKTHNPIQRNGPMPLSLACDNRKFIVERDGTIRFDVYDCPDGNYPALVSPCEWWKRPTDKPYPQLTPKFGSGKGELSRHLDGGWLPKPVTCAMEDGVHCQQCTYVAPIDDRPPAGCPNWYRQRAICVADFRIENGRPSEAEVSLALSLSASDGKTKPIDGLAPVTGGMLAVVGGRVLAFFDAGRAAPLTLTQQPDAIRLSGKLRAGRSARLVAYVPAWPVRPDQYAALSEPAAWAGQVERYWTKVFAPAMQIDIPDRALSDVIRASQVHCLMAARNELRGSRVAPWAAAMVYGPLESESQAVIRGLDMCGHGDFARRGLEFFMKRYDQRGFLTTGYTLVGTGEHLWTLAEHAARSGDRKWLAGLAPQLAETCRWIMDERAKTKRLDPDGGKVPEYGLMPPGVTADWERYAYRFFNDVQYCHGLEAIARQLAAIGYPDAPALLADAATYRADLWRAYRWTQARCPVVPLRNGTWVPNHPAMLDIFGNVEEMVPAEDGNRSWCYCVEIGAHHMAANGLLDPQSPEVARMMDYLEDHQFLRSGWFDYAEEQNRKDVFDYGGFAKVQPYYARNAEVCALRDDVKPFLRSYFNALSALLNDETLSLWEHFHNNGAWDKTHETGWFLCQTATLFAMQRGEELWLAPMIPNRWLLDGQRVAVRNAPTRFGRVSYAITSSAVAGHIDAVIDPPGRAAPKRLVIRLRHPEGKPMLAVTLDGKPWRNLDASRECVSLPPGKKRIELRAVY
jgi:hypothetical protein